MNEHRLNKNSLSPVKQLANVCDSLADDVLDGYIEIDQQTNQRATTLTRAAIEKALSSGRVSDSIPDAERPSKPKTEPPSAPSNTNIRKKLR